MLQQVPRSFPTGGFSKTNSPYLCLFYMYVQDMEVLFVLLLIWQCERAVATDYNQEHNVLSALHSMLHSFFIVSVFASRMHTSVLPRPQRLLLALVFANFSNNFSNAQSGFSSRSQILEPITLGMVRYIKSRCWKQRHGLVLTQQRCFPATCIKFFFYGEISLGYVLFFIAMV